LAHLKFLDVSNNHLKELPDRLGRLAELGRLDVSKNHLSSLPISIVELANLQELDIGSNRLRELPGSAGRLMRLTRLNLSGNELVSMPDSTGQLINLVDLDLSGNRLRALPDSFGKLAKLESLDLGDNELDDLPSSLGRLTNLELLELSGNPLSALPPDISRRDASSVLSFLRERASSEIGTANPAAQLPVVKGRVFLAYVRADAEHVDLLNEALADAGIAVWRDTAELRPGDDWKARVRRAIANDALAFVACFSRQSLSQGKSFMNDELLDAVDQLRLRGHDQPWIFPVRFDDCVIPEISLGGGRTLSSIQWIDLFGDRYEQNIKSLVDAILRISESG
jgi:hypothetical protein